MACQKSHNMNVKLLTRLWRHWSCTSNLSKLEHSSHSGSENVSNAWLQRNELASYTNQLTAPVAFSLSCHAVPDQAVFNSRCFSSLAPCKSVYNLNRTAGVCRQLWGRYGQRASVQLSRALTTLSLSHMHCTKHKPTHIPFRGLKSEHMSKDFVNPLEEIQKYVSVPIFSDKESVFRPTEAEIDKAVQVFQRATDKNAKHSATFVGSFVDGDQVPDMNLPEVCFLGRSNVGKSSLISTLLNTQVNVRVSKKPGHTKTLNLFRVGRHFTMVDMPGYGYNMPRNFQQSVETYLSSSRRLCRTFLLVDGEVGLTSTDSTAVDMLREFGVPYVVVLTKIDKAGRHKLIRNVFNVMGTIKEKGGHTCFSQPFLVSSKTMDGLVYLQTFIAYITGCIQVKGL